MALPLSTIVDVQISRETAAVGQQSFGTPLIVGEHSVFSERIKFVNDMSGVASLGFTSSDIEYKMAQAIFSQTPHPTRLAIGRKEENVQGVARIQFSAPFVSGNKINLRINDYAIPEVTYNSSNANTFADLVYSIESMIGWVNNVTNDAVNNYITITFDPNVDPIISDVLVTGGASQATATITYTTPAVTYASELDKIVLESEDWYALLITSSVKDDIMSAASWIESHSPTKIFSTRSNDSAVLSSVSTTDLGYLLKAKNYDRTFLTYHNVADEYIDAAIIGKLLPFEPGTATFKFKTLNSLSVDPLTQSNAINLKAKNVNNYVTIANIDMFQEGVMSGGEFIDVMIGIDWAKARTEERIFFMLVNSQKVPYTDAGVAMIQNQIEAQMQEAVTKGVFSPNPAPVVTVPKVSSINPTDRANRFLPDITFVATLAGAVHKLTIRGTVTV